MYTCMCIHTYVYTYTYIYIYTCVYVCGGGRESYGDTGFLYIASMLDSVVGLSWLSSMPRVYEIRPLKDGPESQRLLLRCFGRQ